MFTLNLPHLIGSELPLGDFLPGILAAGSTVGMYREFRESAIFYRNHCGLGGIVMAVAFDAELLPQVRGGSRKLCHTSGTLRPCSLF